MMNRRDWMKGAAAIGFAGLAGPALAAKPPVFSDRGLAIRGYDPVAYFTERKPVRGAAAHGLKWRGTTWLFASAASQERFMENPEAYAPQFGGYCSFAVSRGYTATTDPAAWHIHENQLFLNFSLNVRDRWRRDIPGNIALGRQNWPRVLSA